MIEAAPNSGDADASVLPPLEVVLAPRQIVDHLEAKARRGELPGFHAGEGEQELFELRDFGTPFESRLIARPERRGDGTRLHWSLSMRTQLVWVYGVVLVSMVWPGVWLTDSMLKTYFSGYDWATWKWYLPLTAPFVPWMMWSAIKKSRQSARAEATKLLTLIRVALDAVESRS